MQFTGNSGSTVWNWGLTAREPAFRPLRAVPPTVECVPAHIRAHLHSVRA